MSNRLESLAFPALRLDGSNFHTWKLDMNRYLIINELDKTLEEDFDNIEGVVNATKALHLISRHLDPPLKQHFMSHSTPHELWKAITARYDHLRKVLKPLALHEWVQLRFQDFANVTEYATKLNEVTARLRLTGQDHLCTDESLITKTLDTFPAEHATLSTQYHNMNFTTFSELLNQLLWQEQQHSILIRNDALRPTGTPIPPINAGANIVTTSKPTPESHYNSKPFPTNDTRKHHQSPRAPRRHFDKTSNNNRHSGHTSNHRHRSPGNYSRHQGLCHRCGTNGHFANRCRTPDHLALLYKQSLRNTPEANMTSTTPTEDQQRRISFITSEAETPTYPFMETP